MNSSMKLERIYGIIINLCIWLFYFLHNISDISKLYANVGSCTTGKVRRGRGQNKCQEVASLQAGQKLKVTFYNNRTVGRNSNLFSRHLGKLVRDHSMCPLGVSSWDEIEEEKLNHMWAAVEVTRVQFAYRLFATLKTLFAYVDNIIVNL